MGLRLPSEPEGGRARLEEVAVRADGYGDQRGPGDASDPEHRAERAGRPARPLSRRRWKLIPAPLAKSLTRYSQEALQAGGAQHAVEAERPRLTPGSWWPAQTTGSAS